MTNTLTATLRTNQGTVQVRLFPDHAPKTVREFRRARRGVARVDRPARPGSPRRARLYDGTVFHRVIPRFMIQGGDPLGTGHRRPRLQVRRRDPSRPAGSTGRTCWPWPTPARAPTARSSSSPTVPTPHLNGKHTIFGEVIDGSDVVDADQPGADRPQRPPGAGCRARVGLDRARPATGKPRDSATGRGHPDPGHGGPGHGGPHLLPAPGPGDLRVLCPVRPACLPGLPALGGGRPAVRRLRAGGKPRHPHGRRGVRRPGGLRRGGHLDAGRPSTSLLYLVELARPEPRERLGDARPGRFTCRRAAAGRRAGPVVPADHVRVPAAARAERPRAAGHHRSTCGR